MVILRYLRNARNCVTHDGSFLYRTGYSYLRSYNIGCYYRHERNAIHKGGRGAPTKLLHECLATLRILLPYALVRRNIAVENMYRITHRLGE